MKDALSRLLPFGLRLTHFARLPLRYAWTFGQHCRDVIKFFAITFLLVGVTPRISAQIIYAVAYDPVTFEQVLLKINVSTCEICDVAPPSPNIGGFDFVFLPDGSQLHIGGAASNSLIRLSAPPDLNLIWQTSSQQTFYGGVLAPNGLVYLVGTQGLGTYNPANNTVNYIGDWPGNFSFVDDLFYVGSILYGTMTDLNGQPFLIQVNVSDPSQSTVVGPFVSQFAVQGGIWNGVTGIFNIDAGNTDLSFYNPQTGTNEVICDIPPNIIIVGLSVNPGPEFNCLVNCTTDAGILPQGGPYNPCTNATLVFPAATQTTLDANDLLQYILFSNPADTLGSIIATSNTPSFSFNPATMQPGTTYYIAAIAGNSLGGNVDLNDPCLDISNAIQVTWRPLPAVTFSTANPDVCAGACTTVTANFTGTAPFSLTYINPLSGSVTQTFSSNTGSFQVCAAAGAPPGSFSVQATALADAFCTCQ